MCNNLCTSVPCISQVHEETESCHLGIGSTRPNTSIAVRVYSVRKFPVGKSGSTQIYKVMHLQAIEVSLAVNLLQFCDVFPIARANFDTR